MTDHGHPFGGPAPPGGDTMSAGARVVALDLYATQLLEQAREEPDADRRQNLRAEALTVRARQLQLMRGGQ